MMGSLHKVDWSSCFSCVLLALLAVGFIASTSQAQASWWAVGITGCGKRARSINDTCPSCANFRGNNTITEDQEQKCREDHASFLGLSAGARQAIISCQAQFNNSRWNCSTLYGEHLFGSFVTNTRARETGVLNAYFTVGAISGISEDCHDQKIRDCPCIVAAARSEDDDGNVVFETCRADYTFAANYINEFFVRPIDQTDFGGQIDVHNIEVGKRAVNVEKESCRCHGVSGTCSIKTCYKHLPSVSDLSPTLFTHYGGAVRVNKTAEGEIVNVIESHDAPTANDIIFKDPSPNFCERNLQLGTLGMGGRKCVRTPGKPNSCNTMCCEGRHHAVSSTVASEKCEFVWCCRIECRIEGYYDITEYFCD